MRQFLTGLACAGMMTAYTGCTALEVIDGNPSRHTLMENLDRAYIARDSLMRREAYLWKEVEKLLRENNRLTRNAAQPAQDTIYIPQVVLQHDSAAPPVPEGILSIRFHNRYYTLPDATLVCRHEPARECLRITDILEGIREPPRQREPL